MDPDGKETWVKQNIDSTYTVVGGFINNDNGIYIVDENNDYVLDENGNHISIGVSMSVYSFYDYEGKKWARSIIDLNDCSGIEFAYRLAYISPLVYFPLARNNKIFDFKLTGGTKGVKNMEVNRGMPFYLPDGRLVYSSARDIGNYVAGWVAGRSGMGWIFTRMCFDAYQSYKSHIIEKEAPCSVIPQQMGWTYGSLARLNSTSL